MQPADADNLWLSEKCIVVDMSLLDILNMTICCFHYVNLSGEDSGTMYNVVL